MRTVKGSRIRSLVFFGLAGVAGLAGATATGSYRENALQSLGPMRPVVVSSARLAPGKALTPKRAVRRLKLVRVPERFLSADAVDDPSRLIGMVPLAEVPAGSYLSYSQFRPPRPRPSRHRALGGNRRPVEIHVTGAAALSSLPLPARVDVVVTAEVPGLRRVRTFVAAGNVPLLDLRQSPQGQADGNAAAILGLTRRQALDLIDAENRSRGIRLLPRSRS